MSGRPYADVDLEFVRDVLDSSTKGKVRGTSWRATCARAPSVCCK